MKEISPGKPLRLRVLLAFFALSMLFIPSAFAQGKPDFTHAGNLAPIQCRGDQLSVRHVSEDAAMGGVRTTDYVFTNISSSPCTLKGYPRFELLNKAGRPARGGRAANGITMMGDDAKASPQLVTLEPGKTAAFLVYHNAGGAGYMGKPCPVYRRVRITAPGTKRVFILREEYQVCGSLEVSPVNTPSGE
ncbi:MAG TPA: DUF4232 domain-containing protein [Pyrinomonadaceae bacterium]